MIFFIYYIVYKNILLYQFNIMDPKIITATFVSIVQGLIVSVLPCLKAEVLQDSYVATNFPVNL